ncbi:hypothetical protein OV203_07530 [Nannocystis sp. ILAH1]|uniref:hypothetical protein n=1 Tax=unclassified Nannocystis TaxID=2627009 RepID=UPI00227207B6|nr:MULTISPECIES: hypothetical protein [unclassified Nannocystis]MCY0986967.1 hypothetical protein [Nannocystis sp. ILAH1]MCY1071850.1 hypothetical protein [Nannocystis sp. RBIL2]
MSALATSGLACTSHPKTEATEVPAGPGSRGEASCRHDLGRCGGHTPGDGACRSATPETSKNTLEDVVLAPGKFAEINLDMGEGSSTEVTFEATGGPLEWNVHSHDGDNVVIHAEGAGTDGKVRFAAPRAGLYSYLWKNAGAAPVRLTTRLAATGQVRVHSVEPAP